MLKGHGVVIGSETSGGVRNVTVSNCVFEGTDVGIIASRPSGAVVVWLRALPRRIS
jgi:polygalacturonase